MYSDAVLKIGTIRDLRTNPVYRNRTTYLVKNVNKRDIVVDFHGPLGVHQQIQYVSHSGGDPPSSLVVEFVKTLWTVCVGVAGS